MPRSDRLSDNVGAAAGLAFAVLVFVSVAAVDPQRGVSDQALQSWWADSGNRDGFVFSTYTLLLACPLFLLFASRLQRRLRAVDASGWADTAIACAIVVTVALGATAVFRGVVARSMRFADEPLPGVDTLRFATDLTYASWDVVMLFVALLVAVVSILTLVTRVLPRWLGWLGVPVTVGILVAVAVQSAPFALPLLIVWVVATSVHLWRAPAIAPIAAASWQADLDQSSARA